MKFTRDAWIWNLSFIASVLTFLTSQLGGLHAAFPSLTAVADARIAIGAAVLGFISGYLKMSPLALSADHPMATNEASVVLSPVNSGKAIAVVLACVLATSSMACGAKQYHGLVVADQALSTALFALQDAEIASHNAGLITDVKHAAYKAEIAKLLQAGDDLTMALQAWDPSQPAPPSIATAIAEVTALLNDAGALLPHADPFIAKIQSVLTLLQKFGVVPAEAVDRG